jgi:hypothetical protein
LQLTDSVSSTSTTTAATPNAVKTAFNTAYFKMLDWISLQYYRSYQVSPASFTNVANTTYYSMLVVPSDCSVSRIGLATGNSFSGTASVRLGIYSNTNNAPDQLILDAGTVSATAAGTFYQITINQALSMGIYWLATNTQTAATTNLFVGLNGSTALSGMGLPVSNTSNNVSVAGYQQTGVTGAFANASSPALSQQVTLPLVRKS